MSDRRRFQEGVFGERFKALEPVDRKAETRREPTRLSQRGFGARAADIISEAAGAPSQGILPDELRGISATGRAIGSLAADITALPDLAAEQIIKLLTTGDVGEFVRTGAKGPADLVKALLGEDFVSGGPGEVQAEQDELNKLTTTLQTAVQGFDLVDVIERDDKLGVESQIAAAELRKQYEAQIAQVNAGLEQLQLRKQAKNALFSAQEQVLFGDNGLLPGATNEELLALQSALSGADGEPGLDLDVISAIDSIINSNLSGAEKSDRVDFILDRTAMSQNMIIAIDNLTQNRTDLEELLAKDDTGLLGSEASFTTPTLNLDMQFDALGRQKFSIIDAVEEMWVVETGSEIPPEVTEQVLDMIELIQSQPNFVGSQGFNQLIDSISSSFGLNSTNLSDSIKNGIATAQINEIAWGDTLDQDSYTPGSQAFAYAIFQVAVGMGMNPSDASLWAESGDLHKIVGAKSNGVVGNATGGDQVGIGGLSLGAYDRLDIDYESIKGDAPEEIKALIEYILREFGTPDAAMRSFLQTGDWGS